jgi:hypothetical protein
MDRVTKVTVSFELTELQADWLRDAVNQDLISQLETAMEPGAAAAIAVLEDLVAQCDQAIDQVRAGLGNS